MHVELTFILNLWYETKVSGNSVAYGDGSGEVVVEIQPTSLTSDMLRIIDSVVYPYHPTVIRVDGSYLYLSIDYPDQELLEIGSWLDGIDVNRNAPDLWMEGNLEIPEYPEAEFVPALVSCKIDF